MGWESGEMQPIWNCSACLVNENIAWKTMHNHPRDTFRYIFKENYTMSLLPAIEQTTDPNPDAAIIWLHGLGADGNDFAPIVPELRLPPELKIKFIFPHA